MIKVAFGSVPKDGGTFTFYRNQRPALLERGVDLRCVTIGPREAGLMEESYLDAGCVLLAAEEEEDCKQAQAFVEWCERESVDIVIAVNSEVMLSALPHLPERIRVVSRCANAFDHGYRITMSGRERHAAIVALTPRLENDLVAGYGADPGMIHLIPNGIDPKSFEAAAKRKRGADEVLELGFLGRLEHKQKGVLYLPRIVERLRESGIAFRLRIAGKGVHREALEREMREAIAEGQIEFVGALGPDEVPGFLEATDIYLFTSHFEGCPNALLEAMMAGCVPVSWVIEGITDFLLDDGRTGCLVPMGQCSAFADRIVELAANRPDLRALSHAVSEEARTRFSTERAADAYAGLIAEAMRRPAPVWAPRSWDDFRIDPAFKRGWTRFVPQPVKDRLHRVWHHFARSQ